MAGFGSMQALVDSELCGRKRTFTFRKSPSQVSTAGVWFDLSMSPGNPVPQYYAASPLTSVLLRQSTDGGIFHGSNVAPATKHIRKTLLINVTATALPMPMMLCDYLLYYPFIDEGSTDEQPLINSTPLSRYTDGAGVQIMAISVAGRTGGQSFFVNYTNQAGVSGRISSTVLQNTAQANGSVVTTNTNTGGSAGPFIPLQGEDTGVRSIESVTMLGADVGLFSLVLVKPLLQTQIRGIDAPVEVDFMGDFMQAPEVKDDAYLNFLCLPAGTLAASAIHGFLTVSWN